MVVIGTGNTVHMLTMMTHCMTYSILEFFFCSSLGLKTALFNPCLQGLKCFINKQLLLNLVIRNLIFFTRTTTLRITDNSSNNTSTTDTDKNATEEDSMGLPVQTTCTQTRMHAHMHTHAHNTQTCKINMYVSHRNTVTLHYFTYSYVQCQY